MIVWHTILAYVNKKKNKCVDFDVNSNVVFILMNIFLT